MDVQVRGFQRFQRLPAAALQRVKAAVPVLDRLMSAVL
jgi:hypothetical protein